MGKSSRRKARTQQPAPPEAAVSETSGGSQLYTFTPLKLFGTGLLVLGIGFAFGVLVQASLTPSASPTAPARAATPPQTTTPQLPSFADLQAIDGLKEHLAHDPEDLETRLRLGHALFDAGNYGEAAEHYELYLEVRPADADARTDLGIAYRRTRRSDRAADAFRRAIQDAPDHLNAHFNLGIVLANDLDDPAGAAAAWERYLKLAPNSPNSDAVRRSLDQVKGRVPR
jgi:cytochrome c-type biogenesis protein CcmH/NrfG